MKTKKSISALMAVLAGLTLTLAGCVSKPSSSSSTASSNKPYISGIKMGYNDKFNAENCNIDDFIDTSYEEHRRDSNFFT